MPDVASTAEISVLGPATHVGLVIPDVTSRFKMQQDGRVCDGKARLRFVTTNRGKLDFLRIVLEPVVAEGIVESLAACWQLALTCGLQHK